VPQISPGEADLPLEGCRRPRPPPRGGSGRRARRPEFRRRGNRPAEQATGAAPPSSAAASALGTRSDGCKPRCPRLAATSAGRGRSDRRRRLARPARHQLQAPDRSLASAGRAAAVPGGSRGRCPHRCTWRRRPSIHQQAERLPRGDHHRTGMTQIARNRGSGIPQGPRLHFRIHPRMDRLYYPLSIAPRQRRRHLPGRGGARARDRAGRRGVAEHRQLILRAVLGHQVHRTLALTDARRRSSVADRRQPIGFCGQVVGSFGSPLATSPSMTCTASAFP